jgi:hypothetical protein
MAALLFLAACADGGDKPDPEETGEVEDTDVADTDTDTDTDTPDDTDTAPPPTDADGDGYGTEAEGGDDCNDADATIHPSAEEVCEDGLDADCDGIDGRCGAWASGDMAALADVTFAGEQAGDMAGSRVLLADMNADGLDDVLVAAPSADEGATYVALAPFEEGELTLADADARVEGPYQPFSFAVGDADGDGIADLLTGSSGVGSSRGQEVFLFVGPIAGDLTEEHAVWRLHGGPVEAGYDFLGDAQDMADLDGDGADELIVGVPGAEDGDLRSVGGVYVFPGTVRGETGFPGGVGSDAVATLEGVSAGDWTGARLAHGDLDGDGIADLLISWSSSKGGGVRAVYSPVFGTIGLEDADAIWDLTPESGVASITAADLDADGAVEVMIGNPSESTNARGAGAAFVMPGTPGTHSVADAWATYLGTGEWEGAGTALATGDFDGDTTVDFAVGADHLDASEGESSTGGVYLLYLVDAGTHDLLDVSGTFWTGFSAADVLGCSMASGDTDGDEGTDLLVGAKMYGYETPEHGAAYLMYGL